MRIKTYMATTNSKAIKLVREGLGDNAIIISSQNTDDGNSVCIVAAVDLTSISEIESTIEEEYEQNSDLDIKETIKQALVFHGTPPRLTSRISDAAAASNAQNPTLALAAALDTLFEFSSLQTNTFKTPFMLIGPPGSGKTTVAAKLCAQASHKNCSIKEISCDTQRAGGVAQFKALTSILGIDIITASKIDDLKSHINLDATTEMQIIDTAATNPYNEMEMANLHQRIAASEAEPILVLAAGTDPIEVADMVQLYRQLGVRRFIVTQMDIARRMGSILTAADSASLALISVSISAKVADGLKPLSPISLARLIMPQTDNHTSNKQNTEATQ